jgi:hypothetical protein
MPHMHWVARQKKLELPNDEEDVNTRDIHKCDGQAHDPILLEPIYDGFYSLIEFIMNQSESQR